MAISYEEGPFYDPEDERTPLLDTLRDIASQQLGRAALYITDEVDTMTAFTVLGGIYEPLESDDRVRYSGMEVGLLFRTPLNGLWRTANLNLSSYMGMRAYNLMPTELETRTAVVAAREDRAIRHILEQTIFDPEASKSLLEQRILPAFKQVVSWLN